MGKLITLQAEVFCSSTRANASEAAHTQSKDMNTIQKHRKRRRNYFSLLDFNN